MARDEYLEHLAGVPLFSRCNKHQLLEVGKVADELTVPAGTVLTRQGDVARELFILIDGVAVVTRDGKEVAKVEGGGFVGELAVISHTPRTATVTAETDLDLLVLTPIGLSQLLDDIPGLAKHLLYDVAARLAVTVPDYSPRPRRAPESSDS